MKKVARLSIALLTLLLFSLSVYALVGPGEAQEQSSTPDETAGADHTPGPPPSPTPMATGEIGVPSATPEAVPVFPPFPSKVALVVKGALRTEWQEAVQGLTVIARVLPTAGYVPGTSVPNVLDPGKCGDAVLDADGGFRLEVLSGTGKDGCYDLDKNSRVRLETITTKGTCYVELPYIQPQEFMVNDAPLTLRGTPLEVDVGALTCPLAQGVPAEGGVAPAALPDTGGGPLSPIQAPAEAPVMAWVKPTNSTNSRTLFLQYHFDGSCPSTFLTALNNGVSYWNSTFGYEIIHVEGSYGGSPYYDLCVDDVPYALQNNTLWDCSFQRPITGPPSHAHAATWVYGFDTNKMIWAAEHVCGYSSSYLNYLLRHELGHILSLNDVSTCPSSNKPLMHNQYESTYCTNVLNSDEWNTVQDYWVAPPAGQATGIDIYRKSTRTLAVRLIDNSTTEARFVVQWFRNTGSGWQWYADRSFKGNDGSTGTWDGAGDLANGVTCTYGTTYWYGVYIWPRSFTGNQGTQSGFYQEQVYCY